MNDMQKAVTEIRVFARSIKGVLAFAEYIEKTGSMEAVSEEIEARFRKAQQDESNAKVSLAEAQKALSEATERVREMGVRGLADNAELKRQADEIVTNLKEDQARLKDRLAKEMGQEASEHADRMAFAEKSLKAVEAEIRSKSEKLAEIESKLAEIRGKA